MRGGKGRSVLTSQCTDVCHSDRVPSETMAEIDLADDVDSKLNTGGISDNAPAAGDDLRVGEGFASIE